MRFLVKLNDAVMILLADSKKWVQIHTLLWLGLWIVTEQLSASSISGYVYLPAYIYISAVTEYLLCTSTCLLQHGYIALYRTHVCALLWPNFLFQ